jgi:hypothetical protein
VPAGEEGKELVAGLLLRGEPFLGDQVVRRIAAMMGEAFAIPGVFVDRGPGGGIVEKRGGFVEVGDGVKRGDTCENGR